MPTRSIYLSVVIPVYNEAESLGILHKKLTGVLSGSGLEYEILFIDDGSTDNSFSILSDIHGSDNKVRVIKFRKNFGKAAAYSCGFNLSKGEIIVTMDGDLQDEPEDILVLLEKIKEGYDLVSGWKHQGKSGFFRSFTSKVFNSLVRFSSKVSLRDINCPLKAYRREALKEINFYGDLYRFIPLLMLDKGFKISEVKVGNHPRVYGRSKYGPTRFLHGFLDLLTTLFITRYSKRPLHLFGSFGIVLFFSGFLLDSFFTIRGLMVGHIGHSAMLLFGALLMILGVQLIGIGLVVEFMLMLKREDNSVCIEKVLSK
ncbi:MAG: glycosyltransferase family 2 protein [Candidatus Omnitrophota bacterium]